MLRRLEQLCTILAAAVAAALVVADTVPAGMLPDLCHLLPDAAGGVLCWAPPPGIRSACGLILVVVIAGPAMHASGLAAVMLWMLAASASVTLILTVPSRAADTLWPRADMQSSTLRLVITIGLVLLLTYLLAKLALLRRLAQLGRCQPHPAANGWDGLLPTQLDDLARLAETIGLPPQGEGQVLQLTARWGDGKSFILTHLEQALARHVTEGSTSTRRFAVTMVDVWKHESEPDLHMTVVEHLLSNREHSRRLNWLYFPLWLLTGSVLREFRLEISARLAGKTRMSVPLLLPRLLFQRPLERAVWRAQRRGVRTVIVFDEIDRSDPRVAQAALTLVRRSLDRPGVTIVLAYVPTIMGFKALNPMNESMADLASTMYAVLYEDALEGTPRRAIADLAGHAQGLRWSLLEHFASQQPDRRSQLEDRFAEKYLGTPVRLRPLTYRDLSRVLFRFPALAPLTRALLAIDPSDEDAAAVSIGDFFARWQSKAGLATPPIRPLQGALYSLLSQAAQEREQHNGEPLTPQDVAALAAAAMLTERIRQGWAGGGRRFMTAAEAP